MKPVYVKLAILVAAWALCLGANFAYNPDEVSRFILTFAIGAVAGSFASIIWSSREK